LEKLGLVNPTNEEQLSPEKGGPPDGLVKVLIGFKEKPGAAEQAMVRGVGGKIKYTYNLIPAIAASVPEVAIEALKKNPNVTNIELDSMVYALDTELDNSWGVKRIGAGNVHDPLVLISNGFGVKVSIIDTGIDYTHPDLDSNYKGGWDFVNSDDDPMDDNGHGTHVAGIIAAEDNDEGVVGVAPEAELYALKVLDATGSGLVSDVILAIQWATDPDGKPKTDDSMDIINMSLGGGANYWLEAACLLAYCQDRLILVAAAGNSGNPGGGGDNVEYPAAYDSVIAVAATDQSDERARWSSTGSELELAAPGVGIYSTYIGGDYATMSGTSMASPHVAGTAALVWAANPGWSNDAVRTELQDTADDLGEAGWDSKYGWGLVDADEAAGVENEPPTVSITIPVDGSTFESGATILFEGTASDPEDEDLTAGLVWTSSMDSEIGTGGSFSTNLSDGTHTITADVTDSGGKTGSASIDITVGAPSEVVTVESIDPVSMDAGTSIDVTITGSGFIGNAEVIFENGKGPAPTASEVIVVNANTITATVTAKSGGPPRDRKWDVRVSNPDGSSGVFEGGFTVTP
jgi:hypothetical protein